MGIRRLGVVGAAFLGAAAFGYASLSQQPLVQAAPATSTASLATRSNDAVNDLDRQRPRECDRFRNIDTDCTYQ